MQLRLKSSGATQRKVSRALAIAAVVCVLALIVGLIRGRGGAEGRGPSTGEAVATPVAPGPADAAAPAPASTGDAAEAAPSSADASAADTRVAADDPNRADFETFTVVIPPGWERVRQSAGGPDAVLYMLGPDLGQERLRLAISVTAVPPRQTLDEFAAIYCADLSAQPMLMDERVNLGARPARLVKFLNEEGLNHVLMAVYKQRAHVVVMLSPGGEGSDDLSTFNRVMQTFQYRE